MSNASPTGGVLFAKNLDRVATFYSAVLGLTEVNRDGDHILLESAGFQLVVHRMTGDAPPGVVTAPPTPRVAAAYKPVFFVPDISRLRAVVARHGGVMDPVEREWSFNALTVCDALDPEGNVIQFRGQRPVV